MIERHDDARTRRVRSAIAGRGHAIATFAAAVERSRRASGGRTN